MLGMGLFRRAIPCLVLFGLAGCSRSPQVYLEKGNKFASEHNYQEASIQYRKALQKDPQFGEATYRLGLSELEQANLLEAYRLLVRAVELMPENTAAKVKLADVSLGLYWANPQRPKIAYDQVVKLSDQLLAKDPNSFDGLRLKGSQAMLDRQPKQAIDYFTKANAVKPMQAGTVSELVQALLADGQKQPAERLALQLIDKERKFEPIYKVLYTYYIHENRVSDAEELLKKKVVNEPGDPDSLLQLARHYARTRKPEQMNLVLQRLIDDPKTFPKGRFQVGDFYAQSGDWQHALEQFEAGARLNGPDKLTYEKGIVNALMASGKREEASKRLDSLAKEYPKDLEIKAVQASAWVLSRQPALVQAAIAQLEDLTKQKPNELNLKYGLAQAYRAARNWDAARAQFQEILKRNKASLDARLGLAEMGLAQDKAAETLRYAGEVLAVQPEHRGASLLRSAALISMRNYPEAHRELSRVLKASPQDRDAQIQSGTLAILEKNYKEAEKTFGNLREKGDQDLRSLTGLVNAYVAERQFDKAIGVLDDDVKRSPNASGPRRLLASTAISAGRYDVALEQYTKLIAAEPDSPELYMRLAGVHQLKGDRTGVIADLEKAKQVAPKSASASVALASFLQQAGRLEEAKANYQRSLELQPDNIVALNNLAYLLAETGGNLDQAQTLAQRAQQKQPNILTISDTLGFIYLKKNLHDSAIQIFNVAVRKQPENPTYRYHLGLALLQKGEKERARKELQTALTKSPGKEEEAKIKEAIARIG